MNVRDSQRSTLFIILLAGLMVRLFFFFQIQVVLPDEAYYMRTGRILAEQGRYGGLDEGLAPYRAQPFTPLLFSLAYRVAPRDPEFLCAYFAMLSGLGLITAGFMTARKFLSPPAAFYGAIMIALSPSAIHDSVRAMTHPFFNLFWLLSVLFLWERRFFRAGLLMGAAYLVRAEGFVFAFLGAGAACFLAPEDQHAGRLDFKRGGLFLAGFLILALPYGLMLRAVTGRWHIVWMESGFPAWEILRPLEGAPDAGQALGSAMSDYLRRLAREYRLLPVFLTPVEWLLALAGLTLTWTALPKARRRLGFLLLSAGSVLVFYPAVGVEPRYLGPALLILLLFGGASLVLLARQRGPGRLWGFVFLAIAMLPSYINLGRELREENLEIKEAGIWAREHVKTPSVMLVSDSRACFYAGKACAKYININLLETARKGGEDLPDWLKRKGVETAILDESFAPRLYPELSRQLKEMLAPGLVYVAGSDDRRALVYSLSGVSVPRKLTSGDLSGSV